MLPQDAEGTGGPGEEGGGLSAGLRWPFCDIAVVGTRKVLDAILANIRGSPQLRVG